MAIAFFTCDVDDFAEKGGTFPRGNVQNPFHDSHHLKITCNTSARHPLVRALFRPGIIVTIIAQGHERRWERTIRRFIRRSIPGDSTPPAPTRDISMISIQNHIWRKVTLIAEDVTGCRQTCLSRIARKGAVSRAFITSRMSTFC